MSALIPILIAAGMSFMALAALGLGKAKPTDAGAATFIIGFYMALISLFFAWFTIDPGTSAQLQGAYGALAGLSLTFPMIYMIAGYSNMKGYEIKGSGWGCIFFGLVWLAAGIFFWTVPSWSSPLALLYGIPQWFMGLMAVSWAWAFFTVPLLAFGKISAKLFGWTFLIETWYTLFIPSMLLIFNGVLP